MGANIRWFYLPTLSYGGCATFNHCYCELSYKLGEGVESSSAPSPLTFNNCEISLTAAVHGVAQYVVKNNGPTIFNSSIISINPMPAGMETYPFHMHFDVPSNQLELNGCSLGIGIGADTNCKKQSIAGTGGISCSNLGVEVKGNWTVGNRWNLTTGSSSALSPVFSNDTYISNRAHCIPIYAKRVRNTLLPGRDQGFFARSEVFPAQKDSAYMGYGVSGGISISPSGRTITISNIYDAMFNIAPVMGGMPGDIAYDGTTKTVFVVTSVTRGATATMKLYALTNFDASGNLNTALTADSQYLYLANCRMYTPSYTTKFTMTSGSTSLTNVKRPDTYMAYIDDASDGMAVDDYIYISQEDDYWQGATGGKITSINDVSGIIQISAASLYSQDNRRIEYCVRQPPANDS